MQRSNNLRAGLTLQEILPEGHFPGTDIIPIHSVSSDAQQCQPGDTFVALDGVDGDGHDQVRIAIRRGATSVVAERLLPVSVPLCLVPDTRESFGHICHTLAGRPSERLRVIGVTGTNGKTTTSLLVAAVLQAGGQHVGVSHSLGRSGMASHQTPPRTTPNPAELASWMAKLEMDGGTHAVLEASSRGLAERRLAGVQLDAAILTNLRRDHTDFHGSLKNYRRAKLRLLEGLKQDGFAVLNADDAGSQQIMRDLDCPVITIGRREAAEVTATIVERHRSEQTFLLHAGHETIPVRTRMIGDHHVTNCLLATAVGLVAGLPLTTIVRGLESVERIPGRLDRIECGQPFGVFVDDAKTPDQLAVCLQALRRVTQGRLICVFGDESERCLADRPHLGRVAERGADLGIITGGGSQPETNYESIHDILDGYDRPARAHVIPSRQQAILWALDQAQPGDSVLIAGSESGAATAQLADREIARRWLYDTAEETQDIIPFPVL